MENLACIELDHCASPPVRAMLVSDILMTLFIEGARTHFDVDADSLGTLTEEQLALLAQYFRSMGYELLVRTNPLDVAPPVAKNPRSELKDFCERVYDFERGLWHEIAFVKI